MYEIHEGSRHVATRASQLDALRFAGLCSLTTSQPVTVYSFPWGSDAHVCAVIAGGFLLPVFQS